MAHIVSLVYTPTGIDKRPESRYARLAIDRAMLIKGHGIAGDAKGCRGKRQLNIMLAETVEQLRACGFRTGPGELGEQIVIAGLESDAVRQGVRLCLGASAVIEIGSPRDPCGRFARVQGQPAEIARGRIGFMARVVQGGEIEVGTMVAVPRTTRQS